MKKKLTVIFFIISAFIASFWLVRYLDKNGLHLPAIVSQSLLWFESLFKDKSDTSFINAPVVKQQKVKKIYQHNEAGIRPVCKDTSLGPVTYKKMGDIYTWVDEKGISHFSDKAPEKDKFELLNYAEDKVFDYFSLDLNTESLPYDFNQKLTGKINKLFELYGHLLDDSLLKKVDINIQVFANKAAYRNIQKAHNIAVENQSNGFYSYSANKAYLLYTNNTQTMQVAIHEATHAINRAIIGYSPKWLNEGLAEYSEGIQIEGQVAKVHLNDSWSDSGQISNQMLTLNKLFMAESKEWDGKLRQRLYATSWAFIYFMMEKPSRKKALSKLIKEEQKNMCDIIVNKQLEEVFESKLEPLQSEFSTWLGTKVRAQIL